MRGNGKLRRADAVLGEQHFIGTKAVDIANHHGVRVLIIGTAMVNCETPISLASFLKFTGFILPDEFVQAYAIL